MILGLSPSLRLILFISIIFALVALVVSADSASKEPAKANKKNEPKRISFHIGAKCKQATVRRRSTQEQHVEQSVTFRDDKGDNALAQCRTESR